MRALLESHNIPVGKNLNNSTKLVWIIILGKNIIGGIIQILSFHANSLDLIYLENYFFHRMIIILTSVTLVSLLWNMIFGLASMNGSREYTLDLTERISGSTSFHYLAPHVDPPVLF